MDLDIERKMQEEKELRKMFREMFPLAREVDLPWAPCHIKDFLRDRIQLEIAEGTQHFTSRVCRVLCEISPPKTHIEDMARIVVEEAKKYREARTQLDDAKALKAERDEMLECIRNIAKVVGCNHTDDPDGRAKLVRCVRETIEKK